MSKSVEPKTAVLGKRSHTSTSTQEPGGVDLHGPPKRRKTASKPTQRTDRDLLSPQSDEILIRILSFLPLATLLCVAPVSRRLRRLANDSQLWKALYYARFVLPRALRIPGFRDREAIGGVGSAKNGHKLHYSGRTALWADGRRGGLVRLAQKDGAVLPGSKPRADENVGVDWKRQYKIRHNWAKGKCAVEELKIGVGMIDDDTSAAGASGMLVKVVEGIAVTADSTAGLRVWHLKTRQLIALSSLHDKRNPAEEAVPSSLAVDDSGLDQRTLELAVGFEDGSFGVWKVNLDEKRLFLRYRHEKSSNGKLISMAYSHPYLLTATASVLVSLYTFDVPGVVCEKDMTGELMPQRKHNSDPSDQADPESKPSPATCSGVHTEPPAATSPAPFLLTSLKSHTSRSPMSLALRKLSMGMVASIAYTFTTRQGWSIGIQNLHIKPPSPDVTSAPEITSTLLAHTASVETGGSLGTTTFSSPSSIPQPTASGSSRPLPTANSVMLDRGPTSLCYSHPYLLATLPDNTLILHLCTAHASSLSISPGIRLWGHTSGVSDAEITSCGKAVSVSSRGHEMRVWELEGRSLGAGRHSVEIRPEQTSSGTDYDWDERRNWVGFDDEMVIVLKEKRRGRESLMVYDFT